MLTDDKMYSAPSLSSLPGTSTTSVYLNNLLCPHSGMCRDSRVGSHSSVVLTRLKSRCWETVWVSQLFFPNAAPPDQTCCAQQFVLLNLLLGGPLSYPSSPIQLLSVDQHLVGVHRLQPSFCESRTLP